ncbi:hypothetical protein BV22DRAFT_193748 [Leucogyrophana mollusca]|uniref:Uncharacterized protein n=1 Tax=Leucogyrophana mollusca TaxID=85980 RepID=A0ACB8BUT2_9AGAM|nr:hypothetical protein BV22DRAFT_193748 [Leucogyrophana mollusca]
MRARNLRSRHTYFYRHFLPIRQQKNGAPWPGCMLCIVLTAPLMSINTFAHGLPLGDLAAAGTPHRLGVSGPIGLAILGDVRGYRLHARTAESTCDDPSVPVPQISFTLSAIWDINNYRHLILTCELTLVWWCPCPYDQCVLPHLRSVMLLLSFRSPHLPKSGARRDGSPTFSRKRAIWRDREFGVR